MPLLSIGIDAKTSKGEKLGYLTGVMYLAPAQESGVMNTCPMASEGCKAVCLFTAGRGIFKNVHDARVQRTKEFKDDPKTFMNRLAEEIIALERKAKREGLIPVVRLNGTSDLPWENVKLDDGRNIMEHFPHLQFYDYTKIPKRMQKFLDGKMPANYHLTFSRSEHNQIDALHFLGRGGNVAVVFDTKKGHPLPGQWHGFSVVDGDVTDIRFKDGRKYHGAVYGRRANIPTLETGSSNSSNGIASLKQSGVVIGLRAKGEARGTDANGFVQIGSIG